MFRKLRDDSRVVAFGSKLVVVEEMDQGGASIGDGDVPYPTGKPSGWACVVQSLDLNSSTTWRADASGESSSCSGLRGRITRSSTSLVGTIGANRLLADVNG